MCFKRYSLKAYFNPFFVDSPIFDSYALDTIKCIIKNQIPIIRYHLLSTNVRPFNFNRCPYFVHIRLSTASP